MSTTARQTHGVLENGRWLTCEQFNEVRGQIEAGDVVLYKEAGKVNNRYTLGDSSHGRVRAQYLIIKAPAPARTILTREQAALALLQGKVVCGHGGPTGVSRFRMRDGQVEFTGYADDRSWIRIDPTGKAMSGSDVIHRMLDGNAYIEG